MDNSKQVIKPINPTPIDPTDPPKPKVSSIKNISKDNIYEKLDTRYPKKPLDTEIAPSEPLKEIPKDQRVFEKPDPSEVPEENPPLPRYRRIIPFLATRTVLVEIWKGTPPAYRETMARATLPIPPMVMKGTSECFYVRKKMNPLRKKYILWIIKIFDVAVENMCFRHRLLLVFEEKTDRSDK